MPIFMTYEGVEGTVVEPGHARAASQAPAGKLYVATDAGVHAAAEQGAAPSPLAVKLPDVLVSSYSVHGNSSGAPLPARPDGADGVVLGPVETARGDQQDYLQVTLEDTLISSWSSAAAPGHHAAGDAVAAVPDAAPIIALEYLLLG